MPTYDVNLGQLTTNSSSETATSHAMMRTVASQYPPSVTSGWMVGKANSTSLLIAGIAIRATSFATIGSGGTAQTPAPTLFGATAASTTVVIPSYTGGTGTATLHKLIGCGIGGPGAWAAEGSNAAMTPAAGGGANGNLEFISFCVAASQNFEFGFCYNEGVW